MFDYKFYIKFIIKQKKLIYKIEKKMIQIFLLGISFIIFYLLSKAIIRKRRTSKLFAWLRTYQTERIFLINQSKSEYLSDFNTSISHCQKEHVLNSDATTLLKMLNSGII